jgi:pyruvate,water dikinase
MLSHGAVIAREYQVPAVAALEGACVQFTEGTRVALDGQAGTVWAC